MFPRAILVVAKSAVTTAQIRRQQIQVHSVLAMQRVMLLGEEWHLEHGVGHGFRAWVITLTVSGAFDLSIDQSVSRLRLPIMDHIRLRCIDRTSGMIRRSRIVGWPCAAAAKFEVEANGGRVVHINLVYTTLWKVLTKSVLIGYNLEAVCFASSLIVKSGRKIVPRLGHSHHTSRAKAAT